jgi:tripartite-type tricarboxylate transporter receptor subunit TctC
MLTRLLVFLLLLPCIALAQGYPAKAVRVIVPFPPGGTTDLIARIVQPKFQENLGQAVLIENRAGAGGSVGAAEAAKAAPDGYTLLMVFDTHAVNHHIFKMAPDPFKQLDHISLMVRSPSAFVAVTSFAPNNLREIVAYAKANPEKVTYSTPGSGSSNHLAALLLEQHAGIKMTHVAYKGGGPMIQALLGQQVHISFFSMPPMLPHIKAGKVKPIAVGARSRVPQLPDVPTLAEAGCTRFFVALPHEGVVVRQAAPDAEIFVFSGPLSIETGPVFREHRLMPVLNSMRDIAIWEAEGWDGDEQLPAALHVDTGMNRLGLTATEAVRFVEDNALTRAVRIDLVMSHLACADEPDHPLNRRQLESFQKLAALFPGVESSLANSAGIMLGGGFLRDVTRPGIALYGGAPALSGRNPMRPVVKAEARVLQVRGAKAGETVGYGGATWLHRDTLIAIAAAAS